MNQKDKIIIGVSAFLFVGGLLFYWLFLHQPDDFHQGRDMVCRGQYAEAVTALKMYLQKHESGRNASRASFFLAKAYIGLGEFKRAEAVFFNTIETYPDSPEASKSRYKLAFIDLVEGRTGDALTQFKSLANNPQGPLTPEARAMADYLRTRQESF